MSDTPTRWCIVRYDEVPELWEVTDCMRSINGPGDYGWVSCVNAARQPTIAHFEHLHATKEEAIDHHLKSLHEKAALIAKEIADFNEMRKAR